MGYGRGSITCTGTIVHLVDRAAYVLGARHCVVDRKGNLTMKEPQMQIATLRLVDGKVGWATTPVRRAFFERGKGQHLDWVIFRIDREETMRALPLGDGSLKDGDDVVLLSSLRHDFGAGDGAPCVHGDRFRWDEIHRDFMVGGHSGGAIVRAGRVEAIVLGYQAWTPLFGLVQVPTSLDTVPASQIPRVWETEDEIRDRATSPPAAPVEPAPTRSPLRGDGGL